MKKNKIITIPNILSCFRIVLIPFIMWTFFIKRFYVSAGLLVASFITDIIDGFIARHFNMVSAVGKVLDPVADKLTVLGVISSLCVYIRAIIPLLIIFVVKEFIMFVEGVIFIKLTHDTYSARWLGKVTTAFLYLTMLMHILWEEIPWQLSVSLIVVCSTLVFATLIMYSAVNYIELKKRKELLKGSAPEKEEKDNEQ